MNINEVTNSYLGVERQREVGVLNDLVNKNGSCSMNAYLGTADIQFSFDDLGLLEFETESKNEEIVTKSRGVVLDDCVVIKQVQSSDGISYNQLLSWDNADNSYTYIAFDNVKAMDDCYEKLKFNDINLAKGDISLVLTEIGISFDSIAQVLLNQKVDILSSMVDEATSQLADNTSFIL